MMCAFCQRRVRDAEDFSWLSQGVKGVETLIVNLRTKASRYFLQVRDGHHLHKSVERLAVIDEDPTISALGEQHLYEEEP